MSVVCFQVQVSATGLPSVECLSEVSKRKEWGDLSPLCGVWATEEKNHLKNTCFGLIDFNSELFCFSTTDVTNN